MDMLIYAAGEHGSHVQSLVVIPDYKGQDLQHILVDKVIAKLRTRGVHTFQLAQPNQGEKDFCRKWLASAGISPMRSRSEGR